jgi:hypothetical protein
MTEASQQQTQHEWQQGGQTLHMQQQMQVQRQVEVQRNARQTAEMRRLGPAIVTRVIDDLLVFVEFKQDGESFGLVFKPSKIDGYLGEPLTDLGVVVGANISRIEWDGDSMLVDRVFLEHEQSDPTPQAIGA